MLHFIYSLISFLIAIFFILLGVIAILIPWSTNIRHEVIGTIAEHSIAISLFGLCFLAIGVAVVVNILLASKPKYYQFTIGNNFVYIDEKIVQRYLSEYWKELFAGHEIPNRITLKNNQIDVVADLPYVPPAQQEELLTKIQNELTDLFSDLLGYRQQFNLSVSFQPAPSVSP